MSEGGQIAFVGGPDGTLVLQLSGAWRLESGLPSVEAIGPELERASARRLAFDAREVSGWDSALVTFLAGVIELCRSRKIETDQDGLPKGVQRLLVLAAAVPENVGARRGNDRPGWLARIGEATQSAGAGALENLAFIGHVTQSITRLFTGRARMRAVDFVELLQECGASALPIVTLISILVGMILAFVGAVQLSRFGAQVFVADLVAIAMVREMGCIMTAIIMAGRTGSGFAARLGTMTVTQEIDALATLGIPPIDFLVMPRILALCLMMPLLTIYSDVLGIVGGGIVSTGMLDLTPMQYWNEAVDSLKLTSCATGIGKSIVFGALIAIAGCLRGMGCGRSSSAVGDAATSAVVTSIVLIVVADGLFAVAFHLLGI
jgi:phospholipid/cholesterol/gamma-HCH transport system permease protein